MNRSLARLLTLALAAGLATPAAAEACWAPTLFRSDNGYGVAAGSPRLAPLRAALEATEALLRADPALAAIEGFRLQARHSFGRDEAYAKSDTATLWLRFHGPDTWAGEGCGVDQGRADYFNHQAIELVFDDVGPLLRASGATGEEGEPLLVTLDPEALASFRETGLLRGVGEGVRAFRADGRPVLLPFSVGEHLALWQKRLEAMVAEPGGEFFAPQLDALRRHRDGLSAAQLAGQVQVPGEDPEQLWAYSPPGHDGSVPVHQVDPALLRPASGTLRLLTISYYAHADDEAMGPLLARWVGQFDPARAARLLSAGAVRGSPRSHAAGTSRACCSPTCSCCRRRAPCARRMPARTTCSCPTTARACWPSAPNTDPVGRPPT